MSEEQKLDYFIIGRREDLEFIESLYYRLQDVLINLSSWSISYKVEAPKIKEWIHDTFLDKIYEVESKTSKFLTDVSLKESIGKNLSTHEMTMFLRKIVENIKGLDNDNPLPNLSSLGDAIKSYKDAFEITMDHLREYMYSTNWASMKMISVEDYIFQKRRKYITAREELEKAKQAAKNGIWEEVLNHLRPAIENSIKERFGFADIRPMKKFLDNSDDLNLPSKDMVYFIYDEGSKRLHQGKIHTPLDSQTALNFVARFIDQLDLIDISKEKIEEFKQKCKFVK